MTRLNESIRFRLMLLHGFMMLGLGFTLLYIRATMANPFFDVVGGAVAALLVVASLVFLAVVDWLCALGTGPRQISNLRNLLLLSTATAASGLLLAFCPTPTIPTLCYVLAAYTFLLGCGKVHVAIAWKGVAWERAIMWTLAAGSLVFAGFLVRSARQGEGYALAVIAVYCLFIGFQMLLAVLYLQRSSQRIVKDLVAGAAR